MFKFAKTDFSFGTPEELEHYMIITSLDHSLVFHALKSDFVQFLSDKCAEISKQVTGMRFDLSKF